MKRELQGKINAFSTIQIKTYSKDPVGINWRKREKEKSILCPNTTNVLPPLRQNSNGDLY